MSLACAQANVMLPTLLLTLACTAPAQAQPRTAMPAPAAMSGQPAPLPLPEPGADTPDTANRPDHSTTKVVGSLAVALGAFFCYVWLSRRRPAGSAELPLAAVEVLGTTQVGQRQTVHLIRVGCKVLLVAATPQGLTTLTEVDSPEHVRQLTHLCHTGRSLNDFEAAVARSGS